MSEIFVTYNEMSIFVKNFVRQKTGFATHFPPLIFISGGPNPLKGDMLVIGGSMLYAISNVSEVCPHPFFFSGA